MGIVGTEPFKTVGQALSFLNENNPTRARPYNYAEPEAGKRPRAEDFSGESPQDIWASILYAVDYTLRGRTANEIFIFTARNIGDRTNHLSVEDIASRVRYSPYKVRKILRQIIDELETELKRRELLPRENQ